MKTKSKKAKGAARFWVTKRFQGPAPVPTLRVAACYERGRPAAEWKFAGMFCDLKSPKEGGDASGPELDPASVGRLIDGIPEPAGAHGGRGTWGMLDLQAFITNMVNDELDRRGLGGADWQSKIKKKGVKND